jgi:ABC-type nitrate/sulfonate/bicarbonate transport system substrate-binding protein
MSPTSDPKPNEAMPEYAALNSTDDHEASNGSTKRPQRRTSSSTSRENQQRFVTQDGDVLGTLAYMPPEQARGQVHEIDRASDVFGLGAILCEILTGAPPYQGTNLWTMREAATEARLDDAMARLRNCGADAELIALAEQMLAPSKLDRPASAELVSTAIAAHFEAAEERARQAEWDKLAQARPASRIKRLWRRCRQRPIASIVVTALAMMLCVLSVVLLRPVPKLRVGIKPWVGFSPLAVADDLDLCSGIDLVLEPVEDHDDALQKLSRGELDVVLCPLEGHVFARAGGYRTKAVLKLDDSLTADAIVARDFVCSPSDLIGKTIVYVQMDAPHYLLLAFVEGHGLRKEDVELVAVKTAEEAVERFIHGEEEGIAAVAIYEPYLQKALKEVPGAHLLTTAEREAGAIVDILTVDEAYINSDPQHVESLSNGWYEAIRLLKQRDPGALASACKFLGGKSKPPVSEAQYDLMTAGMKYSDRHDNESFFAVGNDGQSEFRTRMLAAHNRLSKWGFLRDTTRHNPGEADGSEILLGLRQRNDLK